MSAGTIFYPGNETSGVKPSPHADTRSARALEEQLKKVEFLRGLGAHRVSVADLPVAGLEFHGQRTMTRKIGALGLIKELRRTIELACFLRLTLLRLMDSSLVLLDHQIAA